MRTELSVVLTAYIFEAFERLLSFKTGHTEAHAPHSVQSEKSTCNESPLYPCKERLHYERIRLSKQRSPYSFSAF
jgi:hypothetical protein